MYLVVFVACVDQSVAIAVLGFVRITGPGFALLSLFSTDPSHLSCPASWAAPPRPRADPELCRLPSPLLLHPSPSLQPTPLLLLELWEHECLELLQGGKLSMGFLLPTAGCFPQPHSMRAASSGSCSLPGCRGLPGDAHWVLAVALELPAIPIRTNTQLGSRQFVYPPGKI